MVAAAARPIILSILKKGRSYGYAIIDEIRQKSADDMQWAEGSIYPVLHKLEKDGLITSEWSLSEKGRNRKYYHISDQGKKALQVEQDNWFKTFEMINRFWNLQIESK